MALPGWDSIESVNRLTRFFTIAGFASLFLLGVFEVLGYLYSSRKDELIHTEQVRVQGEEARAAEARHLQQQQAEQERQNTIAQAMQKQQEAEQKLSALEEKQAPRVLTGTQKAAIVAFLSKHPHAAVTIKSSMSAPDARNYSEQIAAAMRDAGWQVNIDSALFTGTDVSGLWLTIKNPGAAPEGLEILHGAFTSAGIKIRAQYDPGIPKDQDIWLSVGAK